MSEIPKIEIENVGVPSVSIWQIPRPLSLLTEPPVTLQLGFPYVEMPCARFRTDARNNELFDDHPEGNIEACEGAGLPYYLPIEYY